MKYNNYSGSVRIAVLAILMLSGGAWLARALIVPPFSYTQTYVFEATSGDTAFNGSTVTLGIYSSIGAAALDSWDIKDPNFPGDVTRGSVSPSLFTSTITSYSATAFDGMLKFGSYSDSKSAWEYITVLADGKGGGSISDTDPLNAEGVWSAVPDSAITVILFAFAAASLAGGRILQARTPRMQTRRIRVLRNPRR